jgi:amino acid transporter
MSTAKTTTKPAKFGTFLGVYTPSVLTILGLIMYLRFGWVVGNVGLYKTIGIVLMASSITFITGLSASAISTNIKVGVGGEYYMISRSLGLEPGGAIGIPLYLCRTLSVTFYCYGLAEAILILWPEANGALPRYSLQILTAFFIIIVTALSGKSAKLVLKSQIPIMIIVGLSILALIFGVLTKPIQAPIVEVKDPQKSIPKGTLGAVVSGALIYLIVPLFLAITAALSIEQLSDPEAGVTVWTRLAILGPWLVYPAVWGAVLSSAFGSILGGPRILQALSMDGLAPKYFSKLSPSGQPTIATYITGIIALAAVLLGSLNTLAQYVSVLFLTLYVAVNVSAAIEKFIKEPSYRPTIHVPWFVSLIGAAAAFFVMLLINPWASVFAFGLEAVILLYLFNKKYEQKWGDAATGIWMQLSRYSLLKLNAKKIHPRNWRPIIILFVNNLKERLDIVKFTEMLGQNSGILTISKLVSTDDLIEYEQRNEIAYEMQKDLAAAGLQAFTEVNVVSDFKSGMFTVAAAHGIAGLKTNTVVFGWSAKQEGKIQELKIIDQLATTGKNCMVVHLNKEFSRSPNKNIHIWWRGRDSNGDLMLLLSYLIQLNRKWKKAKITILSIATDKDQKAALSRHIAYSIKEARIEANINIYLQEGKNVLDQLILKSKNADLVFLGLSKNSDNYKAVSKSIDKVIKGLKAIAFVQHNGMNGEIPIIFAEEE